MQVFGLSASIDVPGAATGGRVAVVGVAVPPGGGPPAHRHSREDEVFVIRAGRYRFLMDGVWLRKLDNRQADIEETVSREAMSPDG